MRGREVSDCTPNADEGRKDRRHTLLVVPLLAVFLVHPLIVHGCSCGHDFDFHLVSWFEAATQISHGNLNPHWAFTPAWDAGEPRFVFYPPLSWYLGAVLGIVITHLPHVTETAAWSAVPIVFTWVALTLSGLTMYRLARGFASANAALIAAAVYMANPYMLFTAYERTAYGELLAAAWIPLLLDGLLAESITLPRIAIPVALLWLTNVPAAVMGSYALALIGIIRVALEWNRGSRSPLSSAAKLAGGTVLGLALAVFYILPAAYERRYVQAAMATIGGMKIDSNFLFERTGTAPDDLLHDQVLRTASWIAVVLLVAALAGLAMVALRYRHQLAAPRSVEHPLPVAQLGALAAVIAFLLTPMSSGLWHHLPEMMYLQFPWRLLAVLAPVAALAITAALSPWSGATASHASGKAIFAALLIAAALGLPAWRLFHQACDPEDTVSARLALFHSNSGTDPTDEYTPATADNDALQPGDPARWLADTAGAKPSQESEASIRTVPAHFTIIAPRAEFLVLNLRAYPSWSVTLAQQNSRPRPASEAHRADGLVTIAVPPGRSVIDIRYAQTTDQTVGDLISAVALMFLLWVAGAGEARRRLTSRPA